MAILLYTFWTKYTKPCHKSIFDDAMEASVLISFK